MKIGARMRLTLLVVFSVVAASVLVGPPPAGAEAWTGPLITTSDGLVPQSALVLGSRTSDQLQVVVGESRFSFTQFPVQQVFGWDTDDQLGLRAFLYNPGPGPDGLLTIRPSNGGFVKSFTPLPVNGTFQPITGDFDQNGKTDVLWYAPGGAKDYLWLFKQAGGHRSVSLSIDGTYTPVQFSTGTQGPDPTDARAHILWYGSGRRPDSIWTWEKAGAHTSSPVTVNGTDLQPIVGSFNVDVGTDSVDQILWYNPSGPTSVWTWDRQGLAHRSSSLPTIGAGARAKTVGAMGPSVAPSLRRGAFFYRPGPGHDRYWTWPGSSTQPEDQSVAPQLDGTYQVVPGVLSRFEPEGMLRHIETAVLIGGGVVKRYDATGGQLSSAGALTKLPPDPVAGITPFSYF